MSVEVDDPVVVFVAVSVEVDDSVAVSVLVDVSLSVPVSVVVFVPVFISVGVVETDTSQTWTADSPASPTSGSVT